MRHWWRPEPTAHAALPHSPLLTPPHSPLLSLLFPLLLPLSWLFGGLATLRRMLYRTGLLRVTRVVVPVIIVGNLTAGGSGKTPLVIALAQALRAAGYSPGVISRGYGGAHAASGDAPLDVSPDTDPARCGDEPLLIRRRANVPVFVSRNRPRAAQALLAAHPSVNVILSDDGLQHYALARDIEIVVFDARGAGNGRLLPAGPLREPLTRARSVSAIVHNVPDGKAAEIGSHQGFPPGFNMRFVPLPCYRLIDPAETCAADSLAARAAHGRLGAVAGIGHPARFFDTLREAGLVFSAHPFPDHHAFTQTDLAKIDADTIVMTEKDALKCVAFTDARIWVLPVEANIDPALVTLILEKLRGRQAA